MVGEGVAVFVAVDVGRTVAVGVSADVAVEVGFGGFAVG